MRLFIVAIFLFKLLCVTESWAQTEKKTNWDDTSVGAWDRDFKKVSIPSSADGTTQGAMFYRARSNSERPLIISLHTWSGDYTQEDPLDEYVKAYDYNYIHPDFRGPNNTPQACGSPLVISDIEDAIKYAIANAKVDKQEVHIVGASGGGYATLLAYMNIKYPVKSFSAWVPISNVKDWYWESVGRKQKYANDVLLATSSKNGINVEEAKKRSPFYQSYPKKLRKDAKLFIYAGIHDGYSGAVPITQSINMFNKLVLDKYPNETQTLVSDFDKLELVTKRNYPLDTNNAYLGDRKIHYHKAFKDLSLTIFEGGHEQLVNEAIPSIPIAQKYLPEPQSILNIGDSNSSFDYSWPQLLSKEHLGLHIINYGIPGNTIGFNNLGNKRLNTLSNIDSVLRAVSSLHQPLKYLIISLGTNDGKAIFKDKQQEVQNNFDKLLSKIESSQIVRKSKTKILILSIPPVDQKKLEEKYNGIADRINSLNAYYKKKALQDPQIDFIDAFAALQQNIEKYTVDGIHLNVEAQKRVSKLIKQRVLAL